MRARGEGSIYYDEGKDRWYAAVSLPGGKRVKRSAKTQRGAREKLLELQKKTRAGVVEPGPQYTVSAFLREWLATVENRVRPRSYRTYLDRVRYHLEPAFGSKPLTQLSPRDVQAMMKAGLADGLSPSTVGRNLAVLRIALNDAMRWGLLDRNVAGLVHPPRVKRKKAKPMTPDEVATFLASLESEGDRFEALYHVAIGLGLRQGEILGLRWRDVDIDGRRLSVTHTLQRLEGSWVLSEPKSERSKRTLHIPALVAEKLAGHKDRQALDLDGPTDPWPDLVFTTSTGRPVESRNMSRFFHRALDRAGLAKRRFHDLRHTCASFLIAKGINARVVMEVMGHSQISITMNTYGHLMPGQLGEAAERMDDMLRGG